ncbi:MAG: dTDP-4-dehydrorhamnose 3,5-epimerase [Flavobacteriales bacterium]|jgi:dTDP-4-dehydrorhamnose 3,5-epimerase|tara:strand:+ start:252 stop:800 length:549 start_codon:yes stop_codon:yes gene_type:complete
MNLIKTTLDGLVVLKPTIFKDNRGYFMESYNQKNINKLLGNVNFVQDNESESSLGVLRGLHFQKPPYAQAKLVRCLKGSVLDVVLDLRKDSKTYGIFETILLTEENKKQLFIPKGFAHGFVVLSETAIFSYKVDNYYNPDSESGVLWNDLALNIDWKINKKEIIVSEKDKSLPTFNNIINPF